LRESLEPNFLADARDADMAWGIPSFGPARSGHGFRSAPAFLDEIFGWFPFLKGRSPLALTGKQQHLKCPIFRSVMNLSFPPSTPKSTPATLSFKMVAKATDERFSYDDPQKQFRVDGYHATAQMEAQVNVPSIGFSWKSDPLATSSAKFAIIGDEVNGRYYNPTK
jgi:hypothetical protein